MADGIELIDDLVARLGVKEGELRVAEAADSEAKKWERREQIKDVEQEIEALEALRLKLDETLCANLSISPHLAELILREAKLRYSRVASLDVGQKFECERQIQEAMKTRDAAEQEYFLEVVTAIDFKDHVNDFRRLLRGAKDGERAAVIFIRGELEYGRYWLTNRLIGKVVPAAAESPMRVRHSFQSRALGHDDAAIISKLRKSLNLPPSAPRGAIDGEVIAAVCRRLQTRSIVFTFDHADLLRSEDLQGFFSRFWQPLIDAARGHAARCPGSWVMAFFVGSDRLSPPATVPCKSLVLPKLPPFDRSLLEAWIDDDYERLPACLRAKGLVDDIIADSPEGVPSEAMYSICHRLQPGMNDRISPLWESF